MKKRKKIEKDKIHYNIYMGVPILDRWLRYHYINHHVTEIDIKTDKTDTIMTVTLRGEEFPDMKNNIKNIEIISKKEGSKK